MGNEVSSSNASAAAAASGTAAEEVREPDPYNDAEVYSTSSSEPGSSSDEEYEDDEDHDSDSSSYEDNDREEDEEEEEGGGREGGKGEEWGGVDVGRSGEGERKGDEEKAGSTAALMTAPTASADGPSAAETTPSAAQNEGGVDRQGDGASSARGIDLGDANAAKSIDGIFFGSEFPPVPFRVDSVTTSRLRTALSALSPLGRSDVLDADKVLRDERRRSRLAGAGASASSFASADSHDSGREEFDLVEEHVDAAVLILGMSKEVNELRFKLVPARLSEGRFWGAVFRLISRGREDVPAPSPVKDPPGAKEEEAAAASEQDDGKRETDREDGQQEAAKAEEEAEDGKGAEETRKESPVKKYMTRRAQASSRFSPQQKPQPQPQPQQERSLPLPSQSPASAGRSHSFSPTTQSSAVQSSCPPGESGGGEDRESLRQRLRQRDEEIGRLRKGLEEARGRIEELEAKAAEEAEVAAAVTSNGGPSAAQAQASPKAKKADGPPPHRGKWEMDQDSADFLALDDELRGNLRSEKAKRLEEVKSQMRFILDGDGIEYTRGRWTCCGREEYLGGYGCETVDV